MSKIDCSNIFNFQKEKERFCKAQKMCEDCPLNELGCVESVFGPVTITEELVAVIQKWSDEHRKPTRKEKFVKLCRENGFDELIDGEGCPVFVDECMPCHGDNCSRCAEYWNETI